MPLVYRYAFPGLWLAWAVYWAWSSRGTKPSERREPAASRLLHVLPLAVAAWLLGSDRVPVAFLNERAYAAARWEFWIGVLVTAAGLLFSAWARVHLGRNWSAVVTIKQGHELIDTGRYSLVRHPFYTGLLAAVIGCAIARGEWRGLLALAIAWSALWRKLRFEEGWMIHRFGERYIAYCRRVPALLPRFR